MLVLSRKIGEKLVIGDNITVVISKIAGNRVTIGVEAPADVRIVRGELEPHAKVQPATVSNFQHAAGDVSSPRLAK